MRYIYGKFIFIKQFFGGFYIKKLFEYCKILFSIVKNSSIIVKRF